MKRSPKPYDKARLEKAALAYLERFETTEARLAATLERRLRNSHPAISLSVEESVWISDIVAHCVARGYVDDRRFAETRARGATATSARKLRAKLQSRGVSADVAAAAVAAAAEDDPSRERRAAARLAARKRLGPFSRGEADSDPKARERAIGAFLRAGFGFDIARAVLDCPDQDALEAWVAEEA